MIVVSVILHSAVTGQTTELARAVIHNVGGTSTLGDYEAFACRGRDKDALHDNMVAVLKKQTKPAHSGRVEKASAASAARLAPCCKGASFNGVWQMITGLLIVAFFAGWWQVLNCADRGVAPDWFFASIVGALCTTLLLLKTVFGG